MDVVGGPFGGCRGGNDDPGEGWPQRRGVNDGDGHPNRGGVGVRLGSCVRFWGTPGYSSDRPAVDAALDPIGAGYRRVVAGILPRSSAGACVTGLANRQAERW